MALSNVEEIRKGIALQTYNKALHRFIPGEEVTISLIQKKCRCGYYSASEAYRLLISNNEIKETEGKTGVGIVI
ncbi:hypothetical protein M1M25_gp041 [Tenacibaculum phage Gundel_1]|uniref:Uncharacterized protein n=1 Tax=Tenacibaculum phage Gundel_1 TaxID=2745672 RepID=A0A8E4ZM77_9CAUD|nr:hypothetical protein M1M25_gp041 [Tenacibaculum phage Gundel_1]QQV91474.1 hypothetical protein Gundel1_41 [Tenacibaculum phage Gundel_1]